MKKHLLLTSVMLLVWLCTAQAQSPEANARTAVDAFNRTFIDACRTMNNAQTAELWAKDGVDLLPGMNPKIGKAEISEWLNGLTEQSKGIKVLQCDVDWKSVQIIGDVAYEWGINTQTVSVPNQTEPFKNKGKITLILRRQSDGTWKLALESWNSSPQPKPQP